MGSFSIFHYVIVLALVVGIPLLIVKLVRAGTRSHGKTSNNRRLSELADLRDRNLISEEEFQRKRADILRQL